MLTKSSIDSFCIDFSSSHNNLFIPACLPFLGINVTPPPPPPPPLILTLHSTSASLSFFLSVSTSFTSFLPSTARNCTLHAHCTSHIDHTVCALTLTIQFCIYCVCVLPDHTISPILLIRTVLYNHLYPPHSPFALLG